MDTDRNPRIKQAKDLKFPQDFFNLKCIIFSFYVAGCYWFLPRSKFYLVSISIINFILLNWYNNVYQCLHHHQLINIMLSLVSVLLLIYLPVKNKVVLGFSLYFPYFILAWYDYFANCLFRMNPTIFPFGRFVYLPIKPSPYQRRYRELDPIVKQNIANFDKYIVVSIVSITFIYFLLKLIR